MDGIRKTIVVINGSGGSGKDTFINECNRFTRCKNVSSIDPAKECLTHLVGISPTEISLKDDGIRKILKSLKDMSIEFNDYPTKYLTTKILGFLMGNEEHILFLHIREGNEITKILNHIHSKFTKVKTKTVLLKRPDIEQITSNDADANVDDFDYDEIIYNDGTVDDLRKKALDFVCNVYKNALYEVNCDEG